MLYAKRPPLKTRGTAIKTGYKTSKLENGALVVHDVPLMGPQQLTEKHFKNKNIDRAWMKRALENFAKQCKIGKRPLLLDAHNSKDKAAKVVGRLDNLRIDEVNGEPWLCADVIITDAEQQSKFLAGGLPSKSVEFQPDNFYLRALSLLDGHEGHFDYGIPDFVPEGLYEELVALGADASQTVLCHSMAATAKGTSMTNEELLAAINAANKPLLDKLNAVETELATVKNAKSSTTDVDAALQQVRDEERATASVNLAKAQRNATITAYTAQLHSKTKTPEALLRKKLESFTTQEGMDEYFKASMKAASEDVKLGVEREHGDSPDLKEEYEAFKENYPDCRATFADYVRNAKAVSPEGLAARNERHAARGVSPVRNTEEAFA